MTASTDMSVWDDIFPASEPEPLPSAAFDRALHLRNGLTAFATGGSFDDSDYRSLRKEFSDDPSTRELLPSFMRSCRDVGDFWSFIKFEFAHYQERRDFLRKEFEPLLTFLERRGSAASDMISGVLLNYDAGSVHRAWDKALKRSTNDPEGAITAARSLLESVCKHILDEGVEVGSAYGSGDDLPKLYRHAAEKLNLAPSQHSELVFKQVLGGCSSVVEGLGALRNKVGDAHGQGKRQVRVSARHAHLAVNLAGAMAVFLIETLGSRAHSK
jgi:hypothetical protein